MTRPLPILRTAMTSIRLPRGVAAGLAALAGTALAAPVPWLAEAAPAPPSASAEVPAATRPCAAADFRGTAGPAGAWHGFATQELRLERLGAGRCRLDAAPAIELESAAGLRQAVELGRAENAAVRESLDLGPGDALQVLVGTPGACDATIGPERRVSTRLRVALPGGGATLLDGVHVDTICGAARLLRLQPVDTEPAPAPLAALQAAASRVEVGAQELRYLVTLTNAGSRPVELSPCPAYTQTLSTEAVRSETRWRLACAAAGGRIGAGQSVSFEMRAPLPATLSGPGVKLAWSLQDGPAAGLVVPLP
jgi:hypothetical protein